MKIYKCIDESKEEFVVIYKGILIVVTSSSAHAYCAAGVLSVKELKKTIEELMGDNNIKNGKNSNNNFTEHHDSDKNKNIEPIKLDCKTVSSIYNFIKYKATEATEATEEVGISMDKGP